MNNIIHDATVSCRFSSESLSATPQLPMTRGAWNNLANHGISYLKAVTHVRETRTSDSYETMKIVRES